MALNVNGHRHCPIRCLLHVLSSMSVQKIGDLYSIYYIIRDRPLITHAALRFLISYYQAYQKPTKDTVVPTGSSTHLGASPTNNALILVRA